MKYIFKVSFLFYIVIQLILKNQTAYIDIALILVLTAINIYIVKYNNSIYAVLAELAVIAAAAYTDPVFNVMFAAAAFDIAYKKNYPALLIPFAGMFAFEKNSFPIDLILLTIICGMFGYVSRCLYDNKSEFEKMYDMERLQRYELETAKNKLVNSSRETANLAQLKERNRIAGQIHDTIGHSIAGNLMQLQAASKLFEKDKEKSKKLLDKSIEELANSLVVLRDTVHNIKPSESLGIEYIKNIIENFRFCPVEFKYSGDFNTIPANILEILSTNIKEALTNASKHSCATNIIIMVESNENYTRLYIKDNGVGCKKYKEGMGLGGIRERVENVGGSISISSDDGFLIVCVIPNINAEGSKDEGGLNL